MKSKLAKPLILLISLVAGALIGLELPGSSISAGSELAPPLRQAAAQLKGWRTPAAAGGPNQAPVTPVAVANLQQQLDQALRLTSPTRRQEALFNLGQRVPSSDIPQAMKLLGARREPEAATLLYSLLGRWGRANPAAALAWVQTSGSAALRKKGLSTVLADWGVDDPSAALRWAGRMPPGEERDDALSRVFKSFATADPARAWSTLRGSSYGAAQGRLRVVVLEDWANTDPSAAAAAASRAKAAEWWVYPDIASKWASQDPGAALTWAQSIPGAMTRDRAVDSAVKAMAAVDPQAAAAALSGEQGSHLQALAPDIATQWAAKDLGGAMGWATNLPPGLAHDRAVQAVVEQWAQTDPQSAAGYAAGLPADAQGKVAGSIAASWYTQDRAGATTWVNSLETDAQPKAVDGILEDLRGDPKGAENFLSSLTDTNLGRSRMWSLAGSWAFGDLPDAVAWIQQVPASEIQSGLDWNQWGAARDIVSAWSGADPESAWAFTTQLPSGDQRTQLLTQIADKSLRDDPATALTWLKGVSDAQVQSAVGSAVAGDVAACFPPADAATFVAQLPDSARMEAAKSAVRVWMDNDGNESAAAWLGQFPQGGLRDAAAAQFVSKAANDAPAAAAAVISRYGLGETSQQALATLVERWLAQDAGAARAWVQSAALPEDTKAQLLNPSN